MSAMERHMFRSMTAGVWLFAAALGCQPSEKESRNVDVVDSSVEAKSSTQPEKASPALEEIDPSGVSGSPTSSTDDPLEGQVNVAPTAPTPSMASLTDTRWVLQTLNGKPAGSGAGGKAADLTLQGSESLAAGFAGCNQFTGGYMIGEGGLSFGNLAITKRLCPEGMGLERDFTRALSFTRSYRIDGETLSLIDQNGTVVAVLEAG